MLVLLPFISTLLILHYTFIGPLTAVLIANFVFGSLLTVFYIVVAVKAMKIISRSKQFHAENKARVTALKKAWHLPANP
jgi:Na+/proline symporter